MKVGEMVADVRLWEHELPMKWERIIIGQKIKVEKGVFKGLVLRVVGRAHIKGQYYTYCNYA